MTDNPADDSEGQGEMVLLAALVSRVEALVVGSMLEASGVLVNVGAIHHASVSVNSLALGGHRIWVPKNQHQLASNILIEVLGDEEWGFSHGPRRAILRFAAAWLGLLGLIFATGIAIGALPIVSLLELPLSILTLPVNPQGRGDYFLADHGSGGII